MSGKAWLWIVSDKNGAEEAYMIATHNPGVDVALLPLRQSALLAIEQHTDEKTVFAKIEQGWIQDNPGQGKDWLQEASADTFEQAFNAYTHIGFWVPSDGEFRTPFDMLSRLLKQKNTVQQCVIRWPALSRVFRSCFEDHFLSDHANDARIAFAVTTDIAAKTILKRRRCIHGLDKRIVAVGHPWFDHPPKVTQHKEINIKKALGLEKNRMPLIVVLSNASPDIDDEVNLLAQAILYAPPGCAIALVYHPDHPLDITILKPTLPWAMLCGAKVVFTEREQQAIAPQLERAFGHVTNMLAVYYMALVTYLLWDHAQQKEEVLAQPRTLLWFFVPPIMIGLLHKFFSMVFSRTVAWTSLTALQIMQDADKVVMACPCDDGDVLALSGKGPILTEEASEDGVDSFLPGKGYKAVKSTMFGNLGKRATPLTGVKKDFINNMSGMFAVNGRTPAKAGERGGRQNGASPNPTH